MGGYQARALSNGLLETLWIKFLGFLRSFYLAFFKGGPLLSKGNGDREAYMGAFFYIGGCLFFCLFR